MAVGGVLITGFPGFIAGRLVDRLIGRYGAGTRWFFLAEARFAEAARARLEQLARVRPELQGHHEVVVGDIRQERLGLDAGDLARIRARVEVVWHLAALYDLAAPLPLSYAINVEGTLQVLDLCASLDRLSCLAYVSTCYVAGKRTGLVREDELDQGQEFNNHYESTKFWAEKHVQRRMSDLPAIIFRPSIVVGDSVTGETAKGDGPYFVMQLMRRLPTWVPALHFGPSTSKVNLVPVDWVVEAMAHLGTDPANLGKVFQLADPDPLQAARIMELIAHHTGHGEVRGTLPRGLVLGLLRSRRIQRLTGVPVEAFPYFDADLEFDTTHTSAALGAAGPRCPRLADYLPTLIRYAERHPEIVVQVKRASA